MQFAILAGQLAWVASCRALSLNLSLSSHKVCEFRGHFVRLANTSFVAFLADISADIDKGLPPLPSLSWCAYCSPYAAYFGRMTGYDRPRVSGSVVLAA